MMLDQSFKTDWRKMRRRLVLGALALIMATPFFSLHSVAAENSQFKVLGRWATDNENLRPVTYDANVLYAAGETSIEAWDTQAGKRLWSHKLVTPADFRPRLAGDNVLAIGRKFLTALDRKTGEVRWSYRPEKPIGAPFFYKDRIYLGVGNLMTALDADGKVAWTRSTIDAKGIWYAPTASGHGDILFGPGDGLLYALNPDTGEVRWTTEEPKEKSKKWQYLRQLHVSNGTIVAGGYKDNLFGIDAATGKKTWYWYSGNFINSHLVYDGAAYLWSATGWVFSMDAKTGKRNWRAKSDYFPKASGKRRPWAPVMAELVADEKGVYVLDMQYVLHVLDHFNGKETVTIELGEKLRPFVALVPNTRQMFLGNNKGELLHIELAAENFK